MFENLQGWVDDQREVEAVMNTLPFPVFSDLHPPMKDSGRGKTVLIYDYIRKASNGKFPIRFQKIGCCVSQAGAYCVDGVKSVDIFLKKENELWVNETSTEDLYSGARVIIGKGRLGNSDGCIGSWMAKWINEYGAIPRGKYGNIDLSKYDGDRARQWGKPTFGFPGELLNIIRQHPVHTVSLVRSYEEARDLIANGYTVSICSNVGFTNKRDKDGFAYPKGNWNHAMSLLAIEDNNRAKGCIQNSWGPNWISGPKYLDQPDGSFWVDAQVLDRMLKQGDSWAFSSYEGFKPQKLETRII